MSKAVQAAQEAIGRLADKSDKSRLTPEESMAAMRGIYSEMTTVDDSARRAKEQS